MGRFVDLSVTVDSTTMSPPSTNMRLEVTPHNRGPGFWQVSSVHQSLHTGAHIDSPLHVFRDGITTAEISLDQVMGEALVVDLTFAGANHAITIDDLKRGGADALGRARDDHHFSLELHRAAPFAGRIAYTERRC